MLSPALIEDIITAPFHVMAGRASAAKGGHTQGKGLIYGFRNYNKNRNFAMSAASGVAASPSIASRVARNAFTSNLKSTVGMAAKMSFSGGAAAYFGLL